MSVNYLYAPEGVKKEHGNLNLRRGTQVYYFFEPSFKDLSSREINGRIFPKRPA